MNKETVLTMPMLLYRISYNFKGKVEEHTT